MLGLKHTKVMMNYNYNLRYSKFCDFLFNGENPDLLNISYHNITHFISCGKIALHIVLLELT